MSMNLAIIGGNLSRNPELRYTPKGTAVVDIGIAVNRVWTGDDGEKREEVSFFDCTAFGKTAETIGQYFKKGGAIIVEGYLKQETWEDRQTNQKRSKVKVMVSRFHFCGRNEGKGGSDNGGQEPARSSQRTMREQVHDAGREQSQGEYEAPLDDDVPF
jgi:single-strand DNA-binding protein